MVNLCSKVRTYECLGTAQQSQEWKHPYLKAQQSHQTNAAQYLFCDACHPKMAQQSPETRAPHFLGSVEPRALAHPHMSMRTAV